jgi:hypothetical protein
MHMRNYYLYRVWSKQCLVVRFDGPVAFADGFLQGFNINDDQPACPEGIDIYAAIQGRMIEPQFRTVHSAAPSVTSYFGFLNGTF